MSDEMTSICDRFESVYTGVVADALDSLGLQQRQFPHSLTPLIRRPLFAGLAYTVKGQPNPSGTYDENIRTVLRMLGDAPRNSVVVTQANDHASAHLGELSTTALQKRGSRGAVIDGGVRDVKFIRDQGFPVFADYRTPVDAPPRWQVTETNIPVEIGSITVHPGDLIMGDADGLVRIPQDHLREVLERAERKAETEDDIRDAVEQGSHPLDAYEQFGTF